MVKAFQLIYTKLPPGASPWGKQDFHTAFYPLALMQRPQVAEVEAHIHLPSSRDFCSKETVFFQKLQGQEYLVVLRLHTLPADRDHLGRGGIFLCQGLLFPPGVWQGVPFISGLVSLVREALFADRDAVLHSPRINRETGDLAPIDISEEMLAALSQSLPTLATPFERRLVVLLNRWADSATPPCPLLIKGAPEAVSALLSRLLAYVPCALKPRVGWDAALDEGTLTHYPLKIAGYSDAAPPGGSPIKIDLAREAVEELPEYAALWKPESPYERWLDGCPNEATSWVRLEQAYRLSCALWDDRPMEGEGLADPSGFALANRDLVEQRFLAHSRSVLGPALFQHLSDRVDLTTKLALLVQGMPFDQLASYVERLVLKDQLTARDLKHALPPPLIEAGSARLQLIAKVCREGALDSNELEALNPGESAEFVHYLLATQKYSAWLEELLKQDPAVFESCLTAPDTTLAVQESLLKAVALQDKGLQGIASLLVEAALAHHQGFALLRGEVDLRELVEAALKQGRFNNKVLKALLGWAGKQIAPLPGFPYLSAFLLPRHGIPLEVVNDHEVREALLSCLHTLHGYRTPELQELGFSPDSIERVQAQKGGILSWIKVLVRS